MFFLCFVGSIFLVGIFGYFHQEKDPSLSPGQNSTLANDFTESGAIEDTSASSFSGIETQEMKENDDHSKFQDKDKLINAKNENDDLLTESDNQNATNWALAFNSIESVEAHFINEEGDLLKSGLESFFKAKDFDEILDALDKVGTSQKSVLRKNNLKDYFYKEYADTTHSERFSCANKICTVTFIGDSEATEHYQNLSKFSENYIFTNNTVNEYGEGVYKMLLVETDAPSSLRVKSN